MNTVVKICGVEFKNPVLAASGTFGFGREYNEFYDIGILGGICTKGTTIRPRSGNPTPRIAETSGGVLNAIGLQNPGVDAFLRQDLPFLREKDVVVIANIAGATVEDYLAVAAKLDGEVDMIELNISCPNVKEGGVAFGIRPESVKSITEKVKSVLRRTPLIVKLSPNVESIAANALAAEEGGADAISLVNTFTGMAINIATRRPLLANVTGGLSGACIKPVALRMVYEAKQAVKIPVIGMGGICKWQDVVEFMLAGASLVQVGTANFSDPMAMPKIIFGLETYLEKNGIEDVSSLTGALKIN